MGRSLFAKHVLEADPEIRPQNEVIVVDEGGELVAVGRAVLSGEEMTLFKLGAAVKVRRGISEVTRLK
jgi:predicted RNA-binding protein (TIGR00451 family)